MRKQILKRSLCLLLALMLVLPTMPGLAFAQPVAQATPVNTYFSEGAKQLFATQDVVDVLLFLPDRANTQVAIQQLEAFNGAELDKVQERAAVVSELKQVAAASQYEMLNELSAAQAVGTVEAYQSFYIVNALRVKGDRDTVAQMIEKYNVVEVLENGHIEMIKPEINPNAVTPAATDDNIEWNIKHIHADRAWAEHNVDGSGVVVGMIDSGVQWDHPALKAKFRGADANGNLVADIEDHWFNAQDPANKTPLDDPQVPHGSHVMGTILGSEPDGTNRIGVAPGATFIVAKALSAMGGSDAELLAAAEWMLAPGGDPANAPDLINNSWGGSATTDRWFEDVLLRWKEANIMPLHAAGNQRAGEPLPWPGSLSNPANLMDNFAVAATDINDIRGSFSYIGPSLFDETKSVPKPDVSAPGVNIRSSVIGSAYAGGWNGTSMATPAVAGTVALMLEANPDLTVPEIEAVLRKTAMPTTDTQFPNSPNMGYGYGVINTFDAVSEVTERGTGLVTGKVLLSQKDTEAPEFTMDYTGPVYENRDLPISFHVKDDIVTTQTDFMYRQAGTEEWTVINMQPVEGDVTDGLYKVTIPAADIKYPGIETKIVLNDFGRNVESQMLAIPVLKGVTPGYTNSFESEMAGWILEDYWNIGAPKSSLEPAPVTGTQVLGTYVGSSWPMPHPGRYPIPENPGDAPIDDDGQPVDPGLLPLNGEFSALLPPLDLSNAGADDLVMSWKQFAKNPESVVLALEYQDGDQWVELATYGSSDTEWEDKSISLAQFEGRQEGLQLRFRYKIENEVYARGWYIDDLQLGLSASGNSVDLNVTEAQIDFIDQVIPLRGTVRLVELNRMVKSDIRGDYSIRTSADTATVTLKAEAYGYFPQERPVVISKDAVLQEDFIMQPKNRGNLNVVVKDQTGAVVEGAVAILVEEPQAGTATSNAAGVASFTDVYEGEYTVRVYKPGMMPTLRTVAVYPNDTASAEIILDIFNGVEVVHAYDEYLDTEWAGGVTWIPAESGVTLRLVAEQPGLVNKISIFYRNDARNTINTAKVTVFTAKDGKPVFTREPLLIDVVKGQWNEINVEEFNTYVQAGQSIYVASIQTNPGHLAPAVGTMWIPNYELAMSRSFALYPDWSIEPFESVGYGQPLMMRATVKVGELEQATGAPVLDDPYLKYVNTTRQTVTGTTEVAGALRTYVNGRLNTINQVQAGPFSFNLDLTAPQTEVTATITPVDGTESVKSTPARFVLDQVNPELAVTSHTDGETVGSEMIELKGTVTDANLATLSINGRATAIINGTFAQYLTLTKGENSVEVIATDRAGNETKQNLIIIYGEVAGDVEVIELTDPMPATDKQVVAGEQVTLSVKGRTGLTGRVIVQAPFGLTGLPDGLALTETAIGFYEATFTVPQDLTGGLQVTYEMKDGDVMTAITAPGKLIVVNPEDEMPINKVFRIGGATRYTTAVEVSKKAFAQADTVILANGINPIDGIVAGPLAIAKNAPILLTETSTLTPVTLAEIERLQAKNVIIIGGELAIGKAVETALADYTVTRLAGSTRLETSLAVAKMVAETAPSNRAVLANMTAFADVVAIGPVTNRLGTGVAPILLTNKDSAAPETMAFLKDQAPEKVILVGGELVLSKALETQMAAYAPERIAGANRYETSVKIAQSLNLTFDRLAVANGHSPVDSMMSAPLLTKENMVLLLSAQDSLSEPVKALFNTDVEKVFLLGGTGALSEAIELQVRQLVETR